MKVMTSQLVQHAPSFGLEKEGADSGLAA